MPACSEPFGALGAAVLGYDADAARDVPFAVHGAFADGELERLADTPRRYGFHATLKAPFRLAEGKSEQDLVSAIAAFAGSLGTVKLPELAVRALGGFVALVPTGPADDLNRLAASCVQEFDAFRAPMTDAERARRLSKSSASGLTERQLANLERWGYPYVLDEFRFHMTLTGRLEAGDRERVTQALSELFANVPQPNCIADLVIGRQDDADARFVVAHRIPFRA